MTTYHFLGLRIHPECLRGSPRSRFRRIVLLEERETLGWFNFWAKAPVSTSSLPPSTAVVCDNGGPMALAHAPNTSRDVFGVISLLVFSLAPVRSPPPLARPPSPARNPHLQQRRQTAQGRRNAPGWRAGHAPMPLGPARMAGACAATHGDAGTPPPPSPTTYALAMRPIGLPHATEDRPRRPDVQKQ